MSGKRIGLFDSGVGGLSILRSLAAKQGNLKFVYLGDTERCPYGNRSSNEISTFVEEIISWFNSSAVDQIVMACNTSAAVAAPLARSLSEVPVYDLISSTAKYVAPKFKRIAVIATATTCKTNAFKKAIESINPNVEVFELPCPDLVPMVERGVLSGEEVDRTIEKYIVQLKEFKLDSLIFGCTHFPFLEGAFAKALGENVEYVDPAVHLANEIIATTSNANTENNEQIALTKHTYFCTGDAEKFARAAEVCLGLAEGSLKNEICRLSPRELGSSIGPSPMSNTTVMKSPFYEAPVTPS